MDRRTVLGAFRFETDVHTPAMRLIAWFTNLRAGWLYLPYGDQGLFLRRADFFQFGGFPKTPIAEDLFLVRNMVRHGRVSLAPGRRRHLRQAMAAAGTAANHTDQHHHRRRLPGRGAAGKTGRRSIGGPHRKPNHEKTESPQEKKKPAEP